MPLPQIERLVAPVLRGFFLLAAILTLSACRSRGGFEATRYPPDYLAGSLVQEDGCLRLVRDEKPG